MITYVINKDGESLMPTNRSGRVRHLLNRKQARVVGIDPFTIQLLYEVGNYTQDIILGIDPGRTNIGVAAVKEDGISLFSAELITRNKEIPKLMAERKSYRMKHRKHRREKRQRRAINAAPQLKNKEISRILPQCSSPIICKNIKNKEARFCNRKRSEGWLTPTANHLLQTHLNFIAKIEKILPITKVVLEVNKFAFMAMDNPNVKRWRYQNGPLYGKGGVDNAIYEAQEGVCLLCRQHEIGHYHHIVPRHKGGSDTLPNKVGLCSKCHHLVHTDDKMKSKLTNIKNGMNKKYGALSVLNQIIPYLVKELSNLFTHGCYVTDGQSTKSFRNAYGIDKKHAYDAYCIACSVLDESKTLISKNTISVTTIPIFRYLQFRRHDRQCCHKENVNRVYLLDNKKVAANRNKTFEQFDNSLTEYRETATEDEISNLVVKEHKPIYKNRKRAMPGSLFEYDGKAYVLKGTDGSYATKNGRKPQYYVDVNGFKHSYIKCKILKNNTGILFVGTNYKYEQTHVVKR